MAKREPDGRAFVAGRGLNDTSTVGDAWINKRTIRVALPIQGSTRGEAYSAYFNHDGRIPGSSGYSTMNIDWDHPSTTLEKP